MTETVSRNEEVIILDLDVTEKFTIEHAAILSGKTFNEFVIGIAVEKAQQVLEEHKRGKVDGK